MKISVYITCYNQEKYIRQAIESVLAQTLPPDEIIIVDDASKDGSREIIKTYARQYPGKIKVIFQPNNQGVSKARNTAISAASGDYITYLDGDDYFLPEKLERESEKLIQHPEAQFVFSNVSVVNSEGEAIDHWEVKRHYSNDELFLATFSRAMPRRILFRCELISLNALKNLGDYDERLVIYEDYDMKIRMTYRYLGTHCDRYLIAHRRHSGGLSRSKPALYLKSFEYIREKHQKFIDEQPIMKQRYLRKQLNSWRSELIRRVALSTLEEDKMWISGHWKSILIYASSLKYDLKIDARYWLRFFLPPSAYQKIKDFFRVYRKQRTEELDVGHK